MKKIILCLIALTTSLISAQNNSLNFDGVNDAVNLGDNYGFENTDAFSVEAWVKISNTGLQQIVSKLNMNFTGWGLQISEEGYVSAYLFSEYQVNSIYTEGTFVLADNNWHHVAMTFDGLDQLTLYLDGKIETPSSYIVRGNELESIANTSETHIGNYHADGATGEHLFGNIDEVRIWNVERSLSEIAMFYDDELTGTEPGLIGYYKFDVSNSSCDIEDCSTSGIQGTREGLGGGNDLPQFSSDTPAINDVACGASTGCTLGLEDQNPLADLRLFPNPAIDWVKIGGLQQGIPFRIDIYSVTGNLVKKEEGLTPELFIGDLAAGIYLMKISKEGNEIVKKLIVK